MIGQDSPHSWFPIGSEMWAGPPIPATASSSTPPHANEAKALGTHVIGHVTNDVQPHPYSDVITSHSHESLWIWGEASRPVHCGTSGVRGGGFNTKPHSHC